MILNLGAGGRHMEGAVSIDVQPAHVGADGIVWDLEGGLPIGDLPVGEVEAIYSSHLLEHLWFHRAVLLLRDCHTVLRPGGVIRISVPDMTRYWTCLQRGEPALTDSGHMPPETAWESMGGPHAHGHKMFYDFSILAHSLRLVGFRGIIECGYRESHYRPDLGWPDNKPEESIYVEAIKP